MKTDYAAECKMLLPVDTLTAFSRVLPLAGVLYQTMKLRPEQVDQLHVIEGSFLCSHMDTIDVSSGEVPTPADMKRLRKHYLDSTVEPLLTKAGSMFKEMTGSSVSLALIEDGDPVRKIAEICRSGAYSTLVMSRRDSSQTEGKLTGSVVSGVLHRHVDATIYLVGDETLPPGISPFARCLIGIDGSPESKNAVLEAGRLLSQVNSDLEKVYLVHVLDQSCYYNEDGISCMQASEMGQQALEEAGNMLISAGVNQEMIKTVIHFGKPGTVLAQEAVDCDATLIFIGRRDRSRMAQVFLGSVCTDMIQNSRNRTIVLSC